MKVLMIKYNMYSWEFVGISVQAFSLSKIPVSSTVRHPMREHSKCFLLQMALGARRAPSTCA